jgi:RES domain-containing protein
VSRFADLSGEGGMHTSGRWHTAGKRIVYASESVALGLLETLAQVEDRLELPPDYQLLKLEAHETGTPEAWNTELPPLPESRHWGDRWLTAGRSLLARVPAAVAPYSTNWLVNPAHPDAGRLRITETRSWEWDRRLRG